MVNEIFARRIVVASDIGQTVADGGMHYFRDYARKIGVPIRTIIKDSYHLTAVYDQFVPFPGAQEGIQDVSNASDGFIGWYTVRPKALLDQASNWLKDNGFPQSDKVRVSVTPNEKLRQIVNECIRPSTSDGLPTTVILFDDNQEKLLRAGEKLLDEETDQMSLKLHVLRHLILVGYGMDMGISTNAGIQTLGLTSWGSRDVYNLKRTLSNLYSKD